MICNLNLVLSPEYPSVSTALVIAMLAKAIDACGHNGNKTFYSQQDQHS